MALSILRLDMRAPAFSPVAAGDLYATALDMSVWAEKQGFTMVVLSITTEWTTATSPLR